MAEQFRGLGPVPEWERKLATRESGLNPAALNDQRYAGLFQFGTDAATDAGFYAPAPGEGKNAWQGTFNIPERPNVRTLQDFLHDPIAQRLAFQRWKGVMADQAVALGLDKYVGQSVDGVPVTPEGLLTSIHLAGAGGTQRLLEGTGNPQDANGTSALDYLAMGSSASGGAGLGATQQAAAPRRSGPKISPQAAIAELLRRGKITPEQAAAKGYAAPVAAAEESGPSMIGEFGRAAQSGIANTPADVLAGLSAPIGALGYPETAASVRGFGETLRPEPTAYDPVVPSLSDIHGARDLGYFLAGQGGGAVGGTVAPVVAGGLGFLGGGPGGALLAAGGTSYLQNTGQLQSDLLSQGISPETANIASSIGGIPMAALDVLGLGKIANVPLRTAIGMVPKEVAKKGFFRHAGESALTEAATESGQQAIQEGTGAAAGGDRPLSESLENIAQAGVAGLVGGTLLSPLAAGHHGAEPAQPEEQPVAAEQPQAALPPPDYKDPVIRPLIDEHNSLAQRAAGMQERLQADPADQNAAAGLQFLQSRMAELKQQISTLRDAVVTPPPAAGAPAAAPAVTPDWTMPQPDEREMVVFDGDVDTGQRVFVRENGSFRNPGEAPHAVIGSPLAALPDRVPSPQEILDAATPAAAAPVENPKFVPLDEAQRRGEEAAQREQEAAAAAETDRLKFWQEQVAQYRSADPVRARDSLLGFLREQGGVNRNHEGGQDVVEALRDMRLPPGTVRGVGGLAPDEATLRAWEAGYLPGEERPEMQALYDALRSSQTEPLLLPEQQEARQQREQLQAELTPQMEAAGVTADMTPRQAAERLRDWEREQTAPPDQLPATGEPMQDIPFRRTAEPEAEIRRSGAEAPARAAAEARLQALATPLFGRQAKIRAADTITAPGEGTAQTSALGMYQPGDGSAAGIIHVAMRAHEQAVSGREQDRTVYHEGIHHLRSIGAFTDREWKTLKAAAEKDWIKKYDIESLYPGSDQDAKVEEATAEAFADWQAGRPTPMPVRPIFAKIRTFFTRVANAARGMGFRTADDVLRAVSEGKVAQRPGVSGRAGATSPELMAPAGATHGVLQPGLRDRRPGTASSPRRSGFSDTVGAAKENVSTEEQSVKPTPPEPKFRKTAYNPAARTQPPASIGEALQQEDEARLGRVGDALGSALGKVKPGVDGSSIARALDSFRNAIQDNFTPVRRAQEAVARRRGSDITERENVYQQQEFYSGRVADRSERLQREHVAPLLDAVSKAKLTIPEVSEYLYARHAPERNARIAAINPKFKPGEGSGMTDQQAAAVMAKIRQSGRMAEFERVARMVDDMRAQTLNGLVVDGLLSADQAAQWQKLYPNYVPLKGFEGESDMADVMPHVSGGFQVRGAESKKAAGRQSKAADVLENVIMQAQEGIVRGEKNRVFGALHELVQRNPDENYWRVDPVESRPVFNKRTGLIEYRNRAQQEDAKTVWGKVDGKPVRIRLEDPRLLSSIKGLDAERMGAVIRSMAGVTRFLSMLNTSLSPEFVVSNAFRDVIQSQVTGQKYDIPKFASQMRKNYFKALKGAYGGLTGAEKTEWEKLFQQYSRAGGRVGFARIESLNDIRARMAREIKSHGTGPWQMTKKRAFALADYIGRVNGAVDNAVRLAAFKTALDAGISPAKAASIGKNITVNFNRHGTVGPLANAFYMFFNAGVQGNQVLLSAIKGSRKVQKIVGAVVAAGAAQELANRLFGGKDDDGDDLYDKIGGNPDSSDFLKSTNAIFMIPGAGKDGWNYIKIPLPYGLNVFWNLGRNAAAAMMGRQSVGRSIGSVATGAANAFNPIGGAENLLNMMAPTLMDPLVDIYINQNFTGAPVHPGDTDRTLPQSAKGQYWASASQPSVFMARSLNEITGGNDFKPGAVNVNPNDLDHAFGSYAGAAGGLMSRLWASASRAVGLADDPTVPIMQFNEVPFARRIAGGTSPTFDRSTFYERHDQLKIIENQIKGYAEAGDRNAVVSVRRENKSLLPLIPLADQVQRDLAAVRKSRSALIENDKMPAETRKARLDQLKSREQQILLRFNTRWVAANRLVDAA